MKLIVLSSPRAVPSEPVLIRQLFWAGLEIFHLRKPGMAEKELVALLEQIPGEFHPRIVLHSHYGLWNRFPLMGIHRNRSVSEELKEGLVSRSLHSMDEFSGLQEDYTYVFLGPVFDSISKPGYKSGLPHEGIKNFLTNRKEKTPQVIALGGISPDKIKQVREMGFDGAAVLGTVWNTADPVSCFRNMLSACAEETLNLKP